jgi:hypothetical protein
VHVLEGLEELVDDVLLVDVFKYLCSNDLMQVSLCSHIPQPWLL